MGQSLATSLSLQPRLQFPNTLRLPQSNTLAFYIGLLLVTRKKRIIILVVLVVESRRHHHYHHDIVHPPQMDGHLDH
jgi:hypothetical protein